MTKILRTGDLRTPQDVEQWAARLDRDRPQRRQVVQFICEQVAALDVAAPHVLELCPGAGTLAEALLTTLPDLCYTGVDRSEVLLPYVRTRLAPFAERVGLVRADLNGDSWRDQVEQPHAIVSMQSLHDVGDEAAIHRLYRLARELLLPGGLLLNVDFTVNEGEQRVDNPGRLSPARHLALLQACGYEHTAHALQLDDFGGFIGFAPKVTAAA